MTEILAGAGAELAEKLRDWIVARQAAGARLFALEGLMESGKTTLAKETLNKSGIPEIGEAVHRVVQFGGKGRIDEAADFGYGGIRSLFQDDAPRGVSG